MATDNGTTAAKAKAQDAAAAAPTVTDDANLTEVEKANRLAVEQGAVDPAGADVERHANDGAKMTAKKAGVEEVGAVEVVAIASDPAVETVTPDAKGGQSFDYGQKPVEAAQDTQDAAKVAAHDEFLRTQNSESVVVRAAGTSGEVGGESFDYGQTPKK